MKEFEFNVKPAVLPPLDAEFRPAVLANRAFRKAVAGSGNAVPVKIALERGSGLVSVYETELLDENHPGAGANLFYIERLVKTLLWARGGWKITVGGQEQAGRHVREAYAEGGLREFDAVFMGKVYERPFTVELTDIGSAPEEKSRTRATGRHLDGCRIGFDAGGSDRKVSAVIEGESVFSEEVVWNPKVTADPEYHYREIMSAMEAASAHLPRVDAVGVSAAGIYIDNRVMAASLFKSVPDELFDKKVRNMFLDIAGEMGGVPIEVANDGDVTALAGAMSLDDARVFGLAMGTSEAGGYVDGSGNITGELNELAFIPVDYNPAGPVHDWSEDRGCGANYFSQEAAVRLAPAAGIVLEEGRTPAEKLAAVQKLHEEGHEGAARIFESIGVYLGYALAGYCDFYDIRHVLILGRVTSGEGGALILQNAEKVLRHEFPELAAALCMHLPDETSRRVGQSIAAASLPEIQPVPDHLSRRL